MSPSSHVLFVFEGRKAEPNIAANLRKYFIEDTEKAVLCASYGQSIYALSKQVSKDSDLDVFELVCEEIRKRENIGNDEKAVLGIEDRDSISDIYLFFDYDPHCTNAGNDKLNKMLSIFNDSMDKGQLFISYPMVEAIRHHGDDLQDEVLYSTSKPLLERYKKAMNNSIEIDGRFHNWGLYDLSIWKEIIEFNLKRALFLVANDYSLPNDPIDQISIFECQINKHIPNNQIAVLSSFSLMLHEYYGNKIWAKLG